MMFGHASSFNQNIGGWNVNVRGMHRMFNMNNMFSGASAFDQDISGWNAITSM